MILKKKSIHQGIYTFPLSLILLIFIGNWNKGGNIKFTGIDEDRKTEGILKEQLQVAVFYSIFVSESINMLL